MIAHVLNGDIMIGHIVDMVLMIDYISHRGKVITLTFDRGVRIMYMFGVDIFSRNRFCLSVCVRACVRVCACVRACVCARACLS